MPTKDDFLKVIDSLGQGTAFDPGCMILRFNKECNDSNGKIPDSHNYKISQRVTTKKLSQYNADLNSLRFLIWFPQH